MRLALLALVAFPITAQVLPVEYNAAKHLFVLRTAHTTYAMGVNGRGELQNIYWGGALWRTDDIPAANGGREVSSFDPAQSWINEEYPGWGGTRYLEPCLKLLRANGNRDLVLHYASHKVQGSNLTVTLKDVNDPIFVDLNYEIFSAGDIIRKTATLRNQTSGPLDVESFQSGVWHVPHGDGYRLSYLTGRWAAETQLTREPVHTGTKVLESRKGHTSHNANPWFALDAGAEAREESGRVWFGAIGWSGNWRLAIEQTPYNQVRITGGLNTFDFIARVGPSQSLEAPPFYAGYTEGGFGEASRIMHRFERINILPGGLTSRLRPVLYNSWEATGFKVDEAGQKALAVKAAQLGVELFVMDDGWFGKRNGDKAGLGDWTVNPSKFPNGLNPLIENVKSLGMDFGLWVEPEMVNPDSDLYRAHPDWAMHFDGRPRSELRNQLVLNLARTDVKEYVFHFLDDLATKYPIRYFKWDMNRPFAEPGWDGEANPKEIWTQYVRNLYEILERLRAKHPTLEIESCSGGGGRIDLGMLRHVEEVWPSDNTEAFDRLRIQEGFTQAYTPKIMSAWVTDVPNMNGRSTPLTFRFLVAMQGALGIGANLNKWSAEDSALAAKLVTFYKSVRGTVQEGNLYRLLSPRVGELTANSYVSADRSEAVLFAYLHSQQYSLPMPTIRLHGLDPRAVYRVNAWNSTDNQNLSGAYLMEQGYPVRLRGDYDSTAIVFRRVP